MAFSRVEQRSEAVNVALKYFQPKKFKVFEKPG